MSRSWRAAPNLHQMINLGLNGYPKLAVVPARRELAEHDRVFDAGEAREAEVGDCNGGDVQLLVEFSASSFEKFPQEFPH